MSVHDLTCHLINSTWRERACLKSNAVANTVWLVSNPDAEPPNRAAEADDPISSPWWPSV